MRILTLDNQSYNLNNLPEELEEDLRFSVLDNSDVDNPDFFFIPLIFLESFSSPAVVMEINGNEVMMPVDWHLAVGDRNTGNDLEVLPLTSLNDRGFDAFLFNPLKSYQADYSEVKIINFYNDVKWYFPKIKNNQLLSTPLTDNKSPDCAFFVKDISRQCESIEYTHLL